MSLVARDRKYDLREIKSGVPQDSVLAPVKLNACKEKYRNWKYNHI